MSSHASFGCVLLARGRSLILTPLVVVVHISLVLRVVILILGCVVLRWRLRIGGLWLLAHLAIGKLVFCKVFAHFVEAVNGPEGQFGHLNPPIVHRLCVHHHDHQMQTVLFETGCQTGPCCWRHSCFGPIEALAQQFVCVRPRKLPRLILQVLSRARVVLLNHYFANQRILHCNTGELAYVCRSRLVVLM